MFSTVWQRLDTGARLCLPFAVTLLCTLLSVMAWPLPYFGPVAPPLALIAVYYWTIHRPDLFRPWMAFLIGLLNDVVNFLPLGLTALLFVGAHQLVLRQRRFFAGHSFFMMWSGFALTSVTLMIAEVILLSVIQWKLVPLTPVLMQFILVIVLFPLPCQIFIRMQRSALTLG
jgi:rod shape-determining protein MreD